MPRPGSAHWGKAKVEFFSLLPEIQRLFDAKESKRAIFNMLTTDGKLHMRYSTFCRCSVQFLGITGRKSKGENANPAPEIQKKEVPTQEMPQKPVKKPVVKETTKTKPPEFGSFSMGSYTDVI